MTTGGEIILLKILRMQIVLTIKKEFLSPVRMFYAKAYSFMFAFCSLNWYNNRWSGQMAKDLRTSL